MSTAVTSSKPDRAATVVINDVAMEAKVGERLLNVARRNAAHIGFTCDSAGTCQACRCQVTAGAEHLSPPNEIEQGWLPKDRLAAGERFACQAVIRSSGQIQLHTLAEELRLMVMGILSPPPGEHSAANAQKLLNKLVQMGGSQLALFPGNVIGALVRVGPVRFAFPIRDPRRILGDASRVVQKLRTGAERVERQPRVPAAATRIELTVE